MFLFSHAFAEESDTGRLICACLTQWRGGSGRGEIPSLRYILNGTRLFADFLYQEAFLTTYRTFITPIQLIEKLITRYHRFDTPSDAVRQRAARESFSLLVRVVGDLT